MRGSFFFFLSVLFLNYNTDSRLKIWAFLRHIPVGMVLSSELDLMAFIHVAFLFPISWVPAGSLAWLTCFLWGLSLSLLSCVFQPLLVTLKVKLNIIQSCPTLCDHMDYTVHGILQARILEWVAFPFQVIFPTQGLNPGLLNCTQILYQLSHREALLVTLEGDWTFQNFATLLSLTCFSFFFICSHFPLFQWYYLIPGSSESNIWCYLTYYSLHVI